MKRSKVLSSLCLAASVGAVPASLSASIVGFSGFAPVNTIAPATNAIGYSGGGSTLELTDGQGSEASTGFSTSPQDITAFEATYTYTVVGSTNTARSQTALADGYTFIMQNDSRGTAALGGTGGSAGYTSSGTGSTAVSPSAAVGYEMYSGQTTYYDSNGSRVASNTTTGIPVINNGHPWQVTVNYTGTTLNTSYYDTVSKTSVFITNNGVNLPSLVGGNTALIGFGGGTGGASSTQTISNFQYTSTSQLKYQPIALTANSFNQGMIVPASAPASGAAPYITATMDAGTAKTGATYYEMGYNTASASTGLPVSGSTFTSQADSRHVFTMQSYSGNDAQLLTPTNTAATMTFVTPKTYSSLSLLAAVGNGIANVDITVNFSDGAPSILIPYDTVAPDWFFESPAAYVAMGRAYVGTGATTYDNVGNTEPNLYQLDILMPDTVDPISSISLGYDGTSTGGNLAIFAVSGAAVPEPTMGLALLGLTAASTLSRRRRA